MSTLSARHESDIAESSRGDDFIRGRVVVETDPTRHCEILTGPDAAEVLRHEVRPTPGGGRGELESYDCGECHAELRHTDGDQPRYEYRVAEVCPSCICPVLSASDCLAELKTVTEKTVTVGVTAPTGRGLQSLVADLKEQTPSVTVDWVVWNDEHRSNGNPTNAITQRQQEAVTTALDIGYYDTPRGATLDDLAERLDVTKSAVSQRLNAAETKLVKSAFDF